MSEADYTFIYCMMAAMFVVVCGFVYTIYIDLSNTITSRRAREKHLVELAAATAMMNCLAWQKDRQNGPGH